MNTELRDIGTIMWKEWREILAGTGLRSGGAIRLLLVVGVISILVPLRQGNNWVDSPLPIFFESFYIPFALLISTAANAFAGERERHTLETLLASRLPDRSILLGKVAALALVGWLSGIFGAVLQLVVVNLTSPGRLYMYSGVIIAGIVLGSLLCSTLIVALGNLISQRTATMQQAQQLLVLCFFVLAVVPLAVNQFLTNDQRAQIVTWVMQTTPTTLLLWAAGILAAIDLLAVGSAVARFRRTAIFQAR
jgi:ABC-2 type transport system permease protein